MEDVDPTNSLSTIASHTASSNETGNDHGIPDMRVEGIDLGALKVVDHDP